MKFLETKNGRKLIYEILKKNFPDIIEELKGGLFIVQKALIITSKNSGMFYETKQIPIIDYISLELILKRSDGDIEYILTMLSDYSRIQKEFFKIEKMCLEVKNKKVCYDDVIPLALCDFPQNKYKSLNIDKLFYEEVKQQNYSFVETIFDVTNGSKNILIEDIFNEKKDQYNDEKTDGTFQFKMPDIKGVQKRIDLLKNYISNYLNNFYPTERINNEKGEMFYEIQTSFIVVDLHLIPELELLTYFEKISKDILKKINQEVYNIFLSLNRKYQEQIRIWNDSIIGGKKENNQFIVYAKSTNTIKEFEKKNIRLYEIEKKNDQPIFILRVESLPKILDLDLRLERSISDTFIID